MKALLIALLGMSASVAVRLQHRRRRGQGREGDGQAVENAAKDSKPK